MKVYDVWAYELEDKIYEEDGWCTTYADDIQEVIRTMEDNFPGSDWIIIENELPF